MTWRGALLCWLAALLLGGVYAVVARDPAPAQRQDALVAPPEPTATQRAYDLDATALARIEVRRGEKVVVLERAGAGWKVVAPTDRSIPPGLVQAFVQQLVDGGEGERVGDDARNAAYGFAEPQLVISASDASGPRLTLVVGTKTPAGTAAYALVEQDGSVVLVGLNLLYYGDLLLG